MRVVVVGATGNVGTSLLRALAGEDGVHEIVAVARRLPELQTPKTTWVAADIEVSDLAGIFRGADCVVHLAWRIQPSRDVSSLRETNVFGSLRVFRAVAGSGVPALVYASSVGAYSPGPKDRPVDESWPTEGTPTSFYARHKAEVERLRDQFELDHRDVRLVRMRPSLIFKRTSGEEQRRYFLGPLFPRPLARPGAIPASRRGARTGECPDTRAAAGVDEAAAVGTCHAFLALAARSAVRVAPQPSALREAGRPTEGAQPALQATAVGPKTPPPRPSRPQRCSRSERDVRITARESTRSFCISRPVFTNR
jgi:putative NADH-flavin reductase